MELKCKLYDEEWDLVIPKTAYTCKITACVIKTRNSAVTAFKGVHKRSKDNSDVTAVWFENTEVHFIPKNLSIMFSNLVYLSIENCGLKEVSAEDLVGLGNLEAFWAPYNQIATLPMDLFKNTPNLKEVSFKKNLIQSFDPKVLEPVQATIEYFSLSENPGIDKVFEKDSSTVHDFIKVLKLTHENEENARNIETNSKRLENLFTSSKHADFTIEVDGKSYRVHKCILASLSPFFDRMFSNDASLASKTYENIGNVSHAAIEEFLRYFYTRAIPSEENVCELLKLAVDFDVSDLKLHCETIIAKTISPENALDLFKVAVRHSLRDLKRESFGAIQKRHPEIADYLYDRPEVVSVIIEAKFEHEAKKIKLEKKD